VRQVSLRKRKSVSGKGQGFQQKLIPGSVLFARGAGQFDKQVPFEKINCVLGLGQGLKQYFVPGSDLLTNGDGHVGKHV